MAVTPETGRWDALFADRTRGDVGEGIAFVLGFLGRSDLISFAGGFPDPRTFPRDRAAALLAEFAESGEATAFQYTPTQGLAGTLDAVAGRLEAVQGRRPADDELLITSGGIEALELVGKTFLDRGDTVVVEGPTYLGAIMAVRGSRRRSSPSRWTSRVSRSTSSSGVWRAACVRSSSTRSRTTRTPPASRSRPSAARPWSSSPAATASSSSRTLPIASSASTTIRPRASGASRRTPSCSRGRRRRLFPGVRLGWAAGPAEICAKLVSGKQNTDQCSGGLGQRILEEYIRRGWIDEQLVESRALYRSKWERLSAALTRSMPAGVDWTHPTGGFFTWLTLPGWDATELPPRRRSGRRDRPGHDVLRRRPRRREHSALRSACSTSRRSTRASIGSRRSSA